MTLRRTTFYSERHQHNPNCNANSASNNQHTSNTSCAYL